MNQRESSPKPSEPQRKEAAVGRRRNPGSLVRLALQGLVDLYDEQQSLFTLYIRSGRAAPMPLDWSICYTAIVLLGLNRARRNGLQIPASIGDEKRSLNSLLANWQNARRFGHLGLIQWANADCSGSYAPEVTNEISKRSSSDHMRRLPTTELAWLLKGLCATHQYLCSDPTISDLAAAYYGAVAGNMVQQTGLFYHTKWKTSPFDLRAQIGNFADQIYAILALSAYYQTFKEREALELALQCADRLSSLQGSMGQWWWHYHAGRGEVVSRYPVFSVHQDGMAPMALRELSAVSGKDFQPYIHRGLDWLFAANELGLEMVDWGNRVIWRNVRRTLPLSMLRYASMLAAEAGMRKPPGILEPELGLTVNREMRPYELGWLLYAWAGGNAP